MPKMAQTADKWETGCAMAQMRIKDIAAEAGVSRPRSRAISITAPDK